MAYFPFYFSEIPLLIQKYMATVTKCLKNQNFFLVASEVYVQHWANAWLSTPIFEKNLDRLI
jgi:hypothetical protein